MPILQGGLDASEDWKADCLKWRGRILTGKYGHWCYGWDELPIDDTCPEWPCECAEDLMREDKK